MEFEIGQKGLKNGREDLGAGIPWDLRIWERRLVEKPGWMNKTLFWEKKKVVKVSSYVNYITKLSLIIYCQVQFSISEQWHAWLIYKQPSLTLHGAYTLVQDCGQFFLWRERMDEIYFFFFCVLKVFKKNYFF